MSYKYKLHKIHSDEYTCDLYVSCFHVDFLITLESKL